MIFINYFSLYCIDNFRIIKCFMNYTVGIFDLKYKVCRKFGLFKHSQTSRAQTDSYKYELVSKRVRESCGPGQRHHHLL